MKAELEKESLKSPALVKALFRTPSTMQKGVDAAEEVLPGIKNDLLLGKFKPRETDVAAVARASPEERREKAEQLRVIPEKKPKADKESARSGTKRQQEVYATIDKSYEDMKDSKRVTEDSAPVSLRYTARNMVETCDVLFTNFPGLLETGARKSVGKP